MDNKLLKALQDPFAPEDIEWRVQTSGIKDEKVWALVICYVTARAVMDRLDAVLGVTNWQDEYRPWHQAEIKAYGKTKTVQGQLCGISIWDKEKGQFITKWDGAEDTDIEPIKGGISDSFKRAAVKFGIGRYLYKTDPGFAVICENGKYRDTAKSKDGSQKQTYRWNPPKLPNFALPAENQTNEDDVMKSEADKLKLLEKAGKLLKNGLNYKPERIEEFIAKQKIRELKDIQATVSDLEKIVKKKKEEKK